MPMTMQLMLLAAPVGAFHLSHSRGDGLGSKTNKSCAGAGCTNPCECLEWKSVYSGHFATCGKGFEFMPGTSKGLELTVAEKYLKTGFCTEFFMRLADNECVNVVHNLEKGHWWSEKSWCWVAEGCPLASEISPSVNTHAKVKFCDDTDLTLAHFSMEGLIEYAKTEDMDFGLTVKLAFGVSHQLKWGSFKATYLSAHCGVYTKKKGTQLKGKAQMALEADLQSILKDHQAGSTPKHALALVDTGIPPFGVITATAIWEVYAEDPAVVDHDHANTESIVVCLCGDCPQ